MRRRDEVTVGIVVAAAVVLVLAGTLWLKGKVLGAEEITLWARFREVGLLNTGNDVKMRGVPVGKVEEIRLGRGGGAVLVRMSIRAGLTLPRDPVVVLSPKSMFGDWQAEIFPRASFPQYDYLESANPRILPGYTLPDITRLTTVADQIARNLAVLTDRFSIAFTEETAVNIRDAIDNIQDVSAKLTTMVNQQQRTLDEVGGNLEATSAALGDVAAVARRAFAQIDTSIGHGELKDMVGSVQRSTARIDSLTAAMVVASRRLTGTLNSADSAFRTVANVATSLQGGRGTLAQLVRDTTLYTQLVQTNAQIQALLADLQRNPKKYINLKVF
ncbi:MAG: MCE family protein [Gemmatimonadetes bacterium]|nr:MCE family protein [Gemmatimonadota bacterium]